MRKAKGVDVLHVAKSALILSVLVLSILSLSTIANAAFFGLPKAFKTQLDRVELSKSISKPRDYGPFSIDYLDSCQLENVELFVLPKTLTPRFDRIPSDVPSFGDQYFTVI